MYHDVVQTGDPFTMMMRKMVMAVGALLGILVVYGLIQKLTGQKVNSTTYPCYISLIVTFFGSWIYVKLTHTSPTWLIALWSNSLSVTLLLFILSSPNYPWEFSLFALFIAVEMMKVPSVNLIVPVIALLVFGYNFSLGRMGAPFPLMVLPEGRDSTLMLLFMGTRKASLPSS